MNYQTKIGVLIIGMALTVTIGEFTSFLPISLAYVMVAVMMGGIAYIHANRGETVSFIGNSALAGSFLTIAISDILGVSLFPLTVLLLGIGLAGGLHNIVSGFRD